MYHVTTLMMSCCVVVRDGEEVKKIMTLRRRLRSKSVTDASLLSPPSSAAAQMLAGNSLADTESSIGAESESEWTYLLTTDDQLNQSIRKEFYYDHVRIVYYHMSLPVQLQQSSYQKNIHPLPLWLLYTFLVNFLHFLWSVSSSLLIYRV